MPRRFVLETRFLTNSCVVLVRLRRQFQPAITGHCFALLIMLSGCGSNNPLGTVPVQGIVKQSGNPLADGEVRYVPEEEGAGRMARGKIKPDGSFTLTTATRGDGAIPGKYRVIVVAYGPDRDPERDAAGFVIKEYPRPLLVPLRYTKPDTTPLSDIVEVGDNEHREFEID